MKAITPQQLNARLKAGDEPPVLLDIREPWEFAIGSIEGSRNVPLAEITAALPGLDAAASTVVVCHHGIRSAEVADYLERAGFRDVSNLEGGIERWGREVDQSMPSY